MAAAFFYKDLTSYIYTQTRDGYDFSALRRRYDAASTGSARRAQPIGNFTAPYNGQGGNLKGLELTASLPLDLFWTPAEGFGFVASASFNDSNIRSGIRTSASQRGHGDISLPGLSDGSTT